MTEKILFVDDEENILHSIKRELRKRFEIHTAAGGREALEILKKEGPFRYANAFDGWHSASCRS
jgi:DNA-binding NtrC family response regulator